MFRRQSRKLGRKGFSIRSAQIALAITESLERRQLLAGNLRLVDVSFDYDQIGSPPTTYSQGIKYEFNSAVDTVLTGSNFSLINPTTGLAPSGSTPTVTFPQTNVARVAFPSVGFNGVFPEGHYELNLTSSVNNTFRFEIMDGDVNRDLTTNIGDFSIVAANFNTTNRRWTEGDVNGDGQTNIGDFSIVGANFNQTLNRLDFSIDSDNTNAAAPDRSGSENDIEESIRRSGKVITVGNGDIDNDQVPDFADGYNRDATASNADDAASGLKFVPAKLTLPTVDVPSNATVTLYYDASDPATATATTPAAGTLRLWRLDGDQSRSIASHFVAGSVTGTSYSYTAFQAFGTDFFIESVRGSSSAADLSIRIEVDPDGSGATPGLFIDTVRLTAQNATPSYFSDPMSARAGGTAAGADGGDPMMLGYNGALRYGDGAAFFTSTDLDEAELGIISGHSRTWSSVSGRDIAGVNGNGWHVSQWAALVQATGAIVVNSGGRTSQWFDFNGTAYVPRDFSKDRLVVDGSGFRLTDSLGNKVFFHGFASVPPSQRGQVDRYVDSAGNETLFVYGSGGVLQSVTRMPNSADANPSVPLEELTYSFSGGLLSTITMKRRDEFLGTPALMTVRDVQFEYYSAGDLTYGNSGDLKRVTVNQGGVAVEHKLYRYDEFSRLTLVLEGASYERAFQEFSQTDLNTVTPTQLSSTNKTIGEYSDLALEYYAPADSNLVRRNRISAQTIQGRGKFSYDYASDSGNPGGGRTGINTWGTRTTEYLPDDTTTLSDNDQNRVYTNYAAEVLVSSFSSPTASVAANWTTAYQYDSDGRMVLSAMPSATTVADSSAYPATISASAGLVLTSQYVSSGNGVGYLQETARKRGTSGTPIKQHTIAYIARPSATGTPTSDAFLPQSVIEYRDDAGALGITTSYSYTFVGGTADRLLTSTTTLPLVSSSTQNGAGTTATEVEQFDVYGRTIRFTDGDAKDVENVFVNSTGALRQSVEDKGIGPGFLNLSTQVVSDLLGRETSVLNPRGFTTTTTYIDNADVKRVIVVPPATDGNDPPAQIIRDDRATGTLDIFDVVQSAGTLTTTITRREQTVYNNLQQAIAVDRYGDTSGLSYNVSTGVITAPGGTFQRYRTEYGFDVRGRQNKVAAGRDLFTGTFSATNPTITRTQFDAMDRATSTWIGTSDAGFINSSTTHSNLVKILETEYDGGSINSGDVGDSNITKTTLIPGGLAANRMTAMRYDWRNRMVLQHIGVTSDTSINSPIRYCTFDNLDRCTELRVYDGDGITIASLNIDDVDNDSALAGKRRGLTKTFFDDRGRIYRTQLFSVDQDQATTPGTVGGSLATDSWFDNRDNLIKSQAPGGLVTKMQYDGASRLIKQFLTDGDDALGTRETSYASATDVSGDIVLEQTEFRYDANGNVEFTINKQKHDDTIDAGELGNSATAPRARVSFSGTWFDQADRIVQEVSFGNNGGSDLSLTGRPSTPPNRAGTDGWDPYLRVDYAYDDGGRLLDVTSPRGIVTRTYHDTLDRVIAKWEARENEVPGIDDDRGTIYTYNGYDDLTKEETRSFLSAGTRNYITEYEYGALKDGTNVFLNHSGLLNQITLGRPAGAVSGTGHRQIVTGYNALGEPIRTGEILYNMSTQAVSTTLRDNGLSYDSLGRLTLNEWLNGGTRPANMADRGRKLAYTFDTFGRRRLSSTLNASSVVVNQVRMDYDGLGNLVTDWQEHAGAVTGSSAKTQYVYDTNFALNYSRITQTVYPSTRVVQQVYNYLNFTDTSTRSALNTAISRVGFISNSASQANNDRIETYAYLGLDRIVVRDLPRVLNAAGTGTIYTKLSHIDGDISGSPLGPNDLRDDAGASDPYNGLDRFGREVAHDWGNAGQHRLFAYDADSNLLFSKVFSFASNDHNWKSDLYHANGASAATAYDKLGRIKAYSRGLLQAVAPPNRPNTIATPTRTQDDFSNSLPLPGQTWATNADGNYDQSGAGPSRQVFQKDVPIGSSPAINTPNPDAPRTDVFVEFDGWGRLAIKRLATRTQTGGSSGAWTYSYVNPEAVTFDFDALGRRISETATYTELTGYEGTLDLYYDADGNVIQEDRQAGLASAGTDKQYVWSVAEPGMLVLQDTDTDDSPGGLYGLGLDERMWFMTGPDGSIWHARKDRGSSGEFEEFTYTPEGVVTITGRSGLSFILRSESNFFVRYLWRGGRDDGEGLLRLRGGEHDTLRGTPMREDAYSYERQSGATFDWNSHVEWTAIQEQFPDAGTQAQWSSPSTWDVWSDFSGQYAQYTPSDEWHRDVGTVEGMIPGWGSGKQAFAYFRRGEILGGLAESVNVATDVFIVKSLAKLGGKFLGTNAGKWVLRQARPLGVAGAVAAGTGIYDPTGMFDANEAEAGVIGAAAKAALKATAGIARSAAPAQRKLLAAELRSARLAGAKNNETWGLVYGTRRMWGRGYQIEKSLHYGHGEGIDLVFSKMKGARVRYAALETKASWLGGRLSGLRTYSGRRQGEAAYNIDRIWNYLGKNPTDALGRAVYAEATAGRLRSFATGLRSHSMYQLPAGWPGVHAIRR